MSVTDAQPPEPSTIKPLPVPDDIDTEEQTQRTEEGNK